MARKRRRRGRKHHGGHRRRNPMKDWVPFAIGAGMGGLLVWGYIHTVTSTPQLAASTSTPANTG